MSYLTPRITSIKHHRKYLHYTSNIRIASLHISTIDAEISGRIQPLHRSHTDPGAEAAQLRGGWRGEPEEPHTHETTLRRRQQLGDAGSHIR